MTYAVRVANLSVRNRQPGADAVTLVAGRPDLVAVCEVSRAWEPVVRAVPGYTYVGRAGPTHGSREVGLLVRDDVEVVDSDVVQMSAAVPRSVMAHDRWGAWARVVLPGGVRALAYSTHRNAWVQGPRGRVRPLARGTREYRSHVRAERALLAGHAADGWPLLGGGDFNFQVPRGAVTTVEQAWSHSPHRTFASMGLTYVPHGWDGACFDPAAFTAVGDLDVIARESTGSDHDWLTLSVEPRRAPVGR